MAKSAKPAFTALCCAAALVFVGASLSACGEEKTTLIPKETSDFYGDMKNNAADNLAKMERCRSQRGENPGAPLSPECEKALSGSRAMRGTP